MGDKFVRLKFNNFKNSFLTIYDEVFVSLKNQVFSITWNSLRDPFDISEIVKQTLKIKNIEKQKLKINSLISLR